MTAIPVEPLARTVATALRNRQHVDDAEFDRLLSDKARERSARFWSQVRVSQLVAAWLSEMGATRVLDVGAGVGKFCAVASLWSGYRVWGVEQRASLTLEARRLVQRLRAEVVIIEGGLETIDPHQFDAFYLYNPFAEHISKLCECYELDLERSADQYVRDVTTVERWLEACRVGTTMVSYNGVGGRIPSSWTCLRREALFGNVLRLWLKTSDLSVPEQASIEVNDLVLSPARLSKLVNQQPHVALDDLGLLARLLRRKA